MSNELVRRNLESSLSLSMKDMMKFSETVMLLIDTSGSMDEHVVVSGKRRIEALRETVTDIQRTAHVPMIAFGGPYDAQVRFVDVVPGADGGTPLHIAIPFAKQYGATRVVVVSDGAPDLPDQCMLEATAFAGQIDVVFIGDEGDMGSVFLDALAKATGGRRFQGDLGNTKKLAGEVVLLLEGEVAPTRAPIQGPGFTSEETEPIEPDEFDDMDNETDDADDDDGEDDVDNLTEDEDDDDDDK